MKIYKYFLKLLLIICVSGYVYRSFIELIRFVDGFPIVLKVIMIFVSGIFVFMPAIVAFIIFSLSLESVRDNNIKKSLVFMLLGLILPIITAFITYSILDMISLYILFKLS